MRDEVVQTAVLSVPEQRTEVQDLKEVLG